MNLGTSRAGAATPKDQRDHERTGGAEGDLSSAFGGRPRSASIITSFQIAAGKVPPVMLRMGLLLSLPSQTLAT